VDIGNLAFFFGLRRNGERRLGLTRIAVLLVVLT
jgi:hypothetical protein